MDFVFQLCHLKDLWNQKDAYLPDNTMRIRFEVSFMAREDGERTVCLDALSDDMLRLLQNKAGADVLVTCGVVATSFHVHQAILTGKFI